MKHLGDFAPGQTVRFLWSTNAAAGGSITRATNGTISVYKDGSVTQTTTGVTDTEDFDSLTGIHSCEIATTDAFYAAGSHFDVVLSGATIDGETVNSVLASFTIGRTGVLATGTAQAGAAGTIQLAAATSFADDILKGATVSIIAGTGAGQSRAITAWTSATDTATISPNWDVNPDSTSIYNVYPGVPGLSQSEVAAAVADQVLDELTTDHQAAGSVGEVLHATVPAIKTKTDNLPTDPADQSLIIAATDAIVGLIGTPAGADLAADVAAIAAGVVTLLSENVVLKKNTAYTAFPFFMKLTDGSPGTGLTVTVQVMLVGGSFGTVAGAVTEVANGWYEVDLTAAELNSKFVAFKATATGAEQRNLLIVTQD